MAWALFKAVEGFDGTAVSADETIFGIMSERCESILLFWLTEVVSAERDSFDSRISAEKGKC